MRDGADGSARGRRCAHRWLWLGTFFPLACSGASSDDLATPPDRRDAGAPSDLAAAPSDQGTPPDLTLAPGDGATALDLTPPPDLAAPLDLTLAPADATAPSCAPEMVWSGPGAFDQIAVDDQRFYWITVNGPGLGLSGRLKTGGAETYYGPVTYFGDAGSWDVAADGAEVFWMDEGKLGPSCGHGGTLWKAPVAGGGATMLADVGRARRLALDGTDVYFTERPYLCNGMTLRSGGVSVIAKAGGAVRHLAPALRPEGIAVDATHVYWVEADGGGSVTRVPKAGGPAQALAAGFTAAPGPLAIDDGIVYVGDRGDGTVWAIPKGGGPPARLHAPSGNAVADHAVGDLAVDGTHVYWSTGAQVLRIAKDGQGLELIAASSGAPTVALDEGYVYWGAVLRRCK